MKYSYTRGFGGNDRMTNEAVGRVFDWMELIASFDYEEHGCYMESEIPKQHYCDRTVPG